MANARFQLTLLTSNLKNKFGLVCWFWVTVELQGIMFYFCQVCSISIDSTTHCSIEVILFGGKKTPNIPKTISVFQALLSAAKNVSIIVGYVPNQCQC